MMTTTTMKDIVECHTYLMHEWYRKGNGHVVLMEEIFLLLLKNACFELEMSEWEREGISNDSL